MVADRSLRFNRGVSSQDRAPNRTSRRRRAAPDGARRPDLAAVARALADDSRAAIMITLLDGTAWTAGELATVVGVARSTISQHLDRLLAAQLLSERRQGRHRYVQLTDERVAGAVESLATLAEHRPAEPSLRNQRADAELIAGRSCYRHLAGRLGVALTDEWRRLGVIGSAWELTADGVAWFTRAGVDVQPPTRSPAAIRPCLDWTERLDHVAGFVADRFLERALDADWVRRGRHPRAIRITPDGHAALRAWAIRV